MKQLLQCTRNMSRYSGIEYIKNTGMRIRIRSDPLIFGPLDLALLLFSSNLASDPNCNNGYIKLFSSLTKYKPELTNSSLN